MQKDYLCLCLRSKQPVIKKAGLLIFLIIQAFSMLHAGVDYYIDGAKGSDQFNGLSLSTPWKTITKANNELNPGDIVHIRAGTYRETIAPIRSGTSGALITYQRYASEKVLLTSVSNGILLDGKKYIVVDGIDITDVRRFVFISNGSQHNIIKNCRMEGASDWGGVRIENSSHNRILDNYIYNGHGDLVELYPNADHNLIRGNELFGGPLNTHSCLVIRSTGEQDYSSHNIIQNNFIHGACDDNVNVLQKVEHNLFEENIIEDVRSGAGLKFCGGQANIFRKNIVINCKAYGFGIYTSLYGGFRSYGADNVFYNNVVFQSNRGQDMDAGLLFVVFQDGGEIRNNVIKNNIFLDNSPQQIYVSAVEGFKDQIKNNTFSNNIVFSGSPTYNIIRYMGFRYTIPQIESLLGAGFSANLDIDPRFADPANKNFHLRADSPAIDGGAFLTRTASGGNGTEIKVEDARYFSDGFGIIGGDLIQLEGQTMTARITKVDYANNTITLDTLLSWYAGQGIALPYSGIGPDIGANEFVFETSPLTASATASPVSGQVPLTVNFSGNATGGTPPYTFSWDFGDGQFSNSQNPSHTYSSVGTITAVLTVKDSLNVTAYHSVAIMITSSGTNTYQFSIAAATGAPAPGPGGTTDPSPGNHIFSAGTSIQITSLPGQNYRFSRWDGDVGHADLFSEKITTVLDRPKSMTAYFCTNCGDVNGDLIISPADAQKAFDLYLGKIPNPTLCELENADVNCNGTATEPKITPADAQMIFNKFLKKGELSGNCSGATRAAMNLLTTGLKQAGFCQVSIGNFSFASGENISVPVLVDASSEIDSFGFEVLFPSDALEFIGVEKTDWTRDFDQIEGRDIDKRVVRVGGYTTRSGAPPGPAALVTLVFRVTGISRLAGSLSIVNCCDDLAGAQVRSATIQHQRAQGRWEIRARSKGKIADF